jgi:hypothetical protein
MDDRPPYRRLRLDGPLHAFHRAVDPLRWDTVPPRWTISNPPVHQRRPIAAVTW